MGSLWDFDNASREKLERIFEMVRARKGTCVMWEQSRIIDIAKEYGFEIAHATVEHAMDMQWYLVRHWTILARLIKQFGVERTAWAIDRVAGRQNFSIDTAEGILKKEIAAYRKPAGQGNEAPQRESDTMKRAKSYPTPNGVHTEGTAAKWIRERGRTNEDWPQYFERAGQDEIYNWNLYQLKAEYR